ncbi:MAG: hypothetical protein AAF376_00530 [Pseudomonadota bacterium]
MTLTSPAFTMLLLLLGAIWLLVNPSLKAAKAARMELTADELKTFQERYTKKSARADMPTKFNDFAAAADRASRIWILSCLAIIAALFWIIFAGPGLGLFTYP